MALDAILKDGDISLLNKVKPYCNRASFYALVMVIILFIILPLSQIWVKNINDDDLLVRQIDVAVPPPPPPPKAKSDTDTKLKAQGNVSLKTMISSVSLEPLAVGVSPNLSDAMMTTIKLDDLHVPSNSTFDIEGVGFGMTDIDRPPVILIRPKLMSDLPKRMGIKRFEALVFVKWHKDGHLTLISIEKIDDVAFTFIVEDTVSKAIYSKPRKNGVLVDRFIYLPMVFNY